MRRLACGVALLAFGSEARAQWGGGYGDGYPPPRRAPDGYGGRGGYDERAYRRPAPPPEAQRQFLLAVGGPSRRTAAIRRAAAGLRRLPNPLPAPPREAQRPHDGRSVQRPKPKPAPSPPGRRR